MNHQSKLSCPQCFHENKLKTSHCHLCGWSLKQEQLDETHIIHEQSQEAQHTQLLWDDFLESNRLNSDETSQQEIKTDAFQLAGDLAHFEVKAILGQGGMGTVYRAKDQTLRRDVALKVLRPLALSNTNNSDILLDEARMASKLNHPNIVTIYDVARNKDSNYIVMEWVDGQTLDVLIPQKGFSVEKALKYACQITDGLNFAHQKHIIHRDIKPQNIMLDEQGMIKILDFGIASLIDRYDDNDNKSGTGTPSYMSPEQINGLNLDQRTDIFSLGIVFYQMLCGKRPFTDHNLSATKKAICKGRYTPIQELLPDLPPCISQLVDKMLATSRADRWQSSAELAQHIQTIYKELTHQKNWWERRHWLSKAAIILPFILVVGWSSKEILFPPTTQQLIQRQLQEATKVAILPFDNISGDPVLQLFGDGLAINLGTDLAAIASHQGNTWIVPATEIRRMKEPSVQKIANKYGVNLVLTGSLQHMGSTRLMVLNLINAQDGQQLKTAEITIDANQLFQGHASVRTQALALLDWSIPDELTAQFQAEKPQLDGAYKAYVEGIGYLYRYDQSFNLNKAISAFNHAIEIDSNYQLAYVGLAETQLRQFILTNDIDWLQLMEQTISQLNEINPQHPMLSYLSAEILFKKGKYHEAITLFEKNLIIDPMHLPSLFGLTHVHEQLNAIDKIEEIYIQVNNISPNNILASMNLGTVYYKNGYYKKAIEQFTKVTKIAPNNHWAYMNIGAMYYSMGEIKKAIEYTKVAMQINPTSDVFANLGSMYFYQGNYEQAVNMYEKMIELSSKDYINWGNLGDAYLYAKNNKSRMAYQKAIELAHQAIELNPNDAFAISHVAYYLANLNKRDNAMKYAQQISHKDTGQENFLTAAAYALLNETDLAFEHINYAMAKNYSLEEIKNSPLLDNIKKDKRFDKLTD